jgi:predicted 2-oxoglutarate/Fe(II)-dependent dioxygenase YbiX
MEVLHPAVCINVYKNIIDVNKFMHEVNLEIDNQWSDIQWTKSLVGAGSIGEYRTSAEANISHLEHSDSSLGNIFKKMSEVLLNEVMADYRDEHLVQTSGYEGWRLLKYSGGGEYHSHYDHSPSNSRIVSLVAFLEEPKIGGELEFPFFDIKISPHAGDVVVFPSNFPYVHIAHPVTSGTKCSLVTWFQ